MSGFRGKVVLGAGLLLSAIGAVWVISTLRRAGTEVANATSQVAREGQLKFESMALDRRVPTGFESIQSPAQFTGGALFDGKLYLCGPTGLLAYDASGTVAAEYHVGIALPAAPLVRMATGVGPRGAGPQLWIATHGAGLLIFDGKTFRQVRPEAPGARSLTAVLPSATGRVLLGSEKDGVLVWDGKTLAQLHPALAGLRISALAGSETDLWAGTIDDGVLHWHAGQLDRFTDTSGLADARVLSLAVSDAAVFVGTALGVTEFRNGKVFRTLAAGLFANALLVREHTLAIGTLREGVLELPLDARTPRPRAEATSLESNPVQELFEIRKSLYVVAENGLYQNGRQVFESQPARLADRNISALAVDRTGRLWVGYFDRGLDIMSADLTTRSHHEDEHVFCVNRIVPKDDGALTAVATSNGLVLFDAAGEERQVLTKAGGLISSNVTDVLLRSGVRELAMTVATPAGLTMIDASGMNSLYAFHGLVNNHAYTLAAAGNRLLVGTLGGLSMLEAGVIRANYTTANSALKQNWITAIEAVDSDWFIGTYGSGVVKLDRDGRWTTFPDLKGNVEINPNAMSVTPQRVYAGTLGGGLTVYNRASGRWSFVKNGLPSDNVTALAVSSGYLYVGTDNGLVRIAEQQVPLQ